MTEKVITFTELSKYVFGFEKAKIIENAHKDDPLKRDIFDLKKRTDQERDERLKAFWKWETNKSERNAVELLKEIADETIFLKFQAGVIADYTSLIRK